MSMTGMLRRPSACAPLVMSAAALATVVAAVAVHGTVRLHQATDEGAAAHVWQLLMAGQLPIVACFAVKWVPRTPKAAIEVLVLQVCAALAALAPVFLLGL